MNNPDNTLIEFADTQQTMTSVEIAEVTGKNHKDILRAIRNMEPAWEKTAGRKFALSEYKDKSGKMSPMYVLTKTETLYIATKFNDEARARLVIRWEQLERSRQPQQPLVVQQPAVMPALSRRQLLLMALQSEEECERLREEKRQMQYDMVTMSLELGRRYEIIQRLSLPTEPLPTVQQPRPAARKSAVVQPAAADPPQPTAMQPDTDGNATVTVTQIAQDYGMGAPSFNKLLSGLRIQRKVGQQWVLYAEYLNRGYVATRMIPIHHAGQPDTYKPLTAWTQAGRNFLYERLKRNGILPLNEREQTTEGPKKGGRP